MEKPPLKTSFLKLAFNLEKKFSDILMVNEVHFRGNLNSISFISISHEKPELGVKCNLHRKWDEEIIQNYINRIKAKPVPQRPTPEKLLQSWIIRKSRENNNFFTFDNSIRFITSELAIVDDIKGKIVPDILGFDTEKNRLVIIEIKSKRNLGRLIEQVKNFENIIYKNLYFFNELLELFGYQIKNEPLKVIIWPKPKKMSLSDLGSRNIIEYIYETKNNDFIIKKV